MKRLLLGLAASLALATVAQAQTVIVVRHAEKADQSADPELSDAGLARGDALAESLANAGLTHVFVTPLKRTGLTASAAAQAAGVEAVAISLEGSVPAHVARVAEQVRALPADSVVLIVGHSNTVPDIVRGLGGEATPMTDCEYDRLTILSLKANGAHTIRGRYGVGSNPCAD